MDYTELVRLLEAVGSPAANIILGIAVYILRQEVRSFKDKFVILEQSDQRLMQREDGYVRKDLFAEILRSHNETNERLIEDNREIFRRIIDLERRSND